LLANEANKNIKDVNAKINMRDAVTSALGVKNLSEVGELTKAQQKQAMNNFEYSLMSASAEVSNAMTVYQKSEEKSKLLASQVENLEKSVEYTQELLSLGTATYLEVLNAQTSLLSAQMSQISCELSRQQAVINLYQSLGGGRQ
jgi:outer membrane protein TolC